MISTYMSTTFISQLGSLQNTIVYNSSCYSGLTLATEYFPTPIASTYLSKNPLAYYGWKKANGGSSTVGDSECQIAETKYVQNISEADSSGIAHLNDDGTEFLAFNNWNQPAPKTKLVLFNQPTWCFTDCGLGTLTDTRDGKVYATTCIDGKTWMAENLNYAGAGMCFNSTANCNTFGRLYDWNTVSGGSSSNANPSTVQGVCPQGWHLPSIAEWNELIDFAGGATIAGRKLKAISPLWEDSNTNTDAYGFSALPGGECSEDGSGGIDCFNQGDDANFWSSSEPAGQYVFITGGDFIISNFAPLGSNFSCRCVKD